jgi:hypothetical protein
LGIVLVLVILIQKVQVACWHVVVRKKTLLQNYCEKNEVMKMNTICCWGFLNVYLNTRGLLAASNTSSLNYSPVITKYVTDCGSSVIETLTL